jgi:hypothetical protein
MKATSINGRVIAILSKESAGARERAAKLEKEAAELRSNLVNLQRQVGPRSLDGNILTRIPGDAPKGEFEILYAAEEQDARVLALSLRVLLVKAGWKLIDERPVPSAELLRSAKVFPMNVEIVVRNLKEQGVPIILPPDKNAEPRTLFAVLSAAIMSALGMTRVAGGEDASPPEGRARIIVFPRSGMREINMISPQALPQHTPQSRINQEKMQKLQLSGWRAPSLHPCGACYIIPEILVGIARRPERSRVGRMSGA